jgi:hypothetical protein
MKNRGLREEANKDRMNIKEAPSFDAYSVEVTLPVKI